MIGGCINLRQSRRTRFNKCKYWKRNDKVRDLSEYKHLEAYDGVFYAKEENSKSYRKNALGGAFLYDESNLTISTSDIVNVEVDDIVEFQNQCWRVVSVQEKEIHQQSEFLTRIDKITYLELKR